VTGLPAQAAPSDPATALALLAGAPTDVADGLAFTRAGLAEGSAPTVLLVHGVGAARLVWATVLPQLAERYHVLAVDLPGHGWSAPLAPGQDARCRALGRQVAAACAELGVARPHVVGNSLGGWIGLEMAADDAVRSLTALAPAGLRIAPTAPSPLLRLNRLLARTVGRSTEPLLRHDGVRRLVFASGSADPASLDPGLARATVRALREATAYEAMLDATGHERFLRRRDVTVPTTIVFGDRDRILPRPNQRREVAPDAAEWIVLPRCGHAPMWDAPQRCLQIIGDTVERAGERRTG
jgi:pimeloyl-ACP methyl ester carboxylesterase